MRKRLLSLSFLIIIIIFSLNIDVYDLFATGYTNDKIKGLEQEIANNRDERKKLQATLSDVQSIKQRLTNSRNDLARFIEELDNNLEIIENNITELLELIALKEIEIEDKTLELEEALEALQTLYEAMKDRLKFTYEQGETHYIAILFSGGNLSEMLNRADYIEKMSQYDEEKLNEFIEYSNYVALCKENLELEKEFLDEAKEAVEKEREAINQLIGQKKVEIEAIKGDIAAQERAIQEYEAEIAAQNEMIKALERAAAEERARLAAENARKYDGGKFSWPVPSSRRITDDYGNRIHPILNVPQFHNGIDIAAPTGNTIVSAYQGKVVASAYSSTMGNYIMID
ncbi:MAG: peptidoglycan DD-metalloendopeptidase family protein, partial [Lachnospiraceae bacterium]|nr:peptidoglycan DD-metalloendopeptidase family protein [Lachnospiraceae bacterium]